MNFPDAVTTCFRKYADFSGRASRSECWWFVLFAVVCFLGLDLLLGERHFLTIVLKLGAIIPSLSVGTRRLHDIDKSGWFQLVCFIPLIGFFLLLYWWAKQGDPYENRFGVPVSPLGEP